MNTTADIDTLEQEQLRPSDEILEQAARSWMRKPLLDTRASCFGFVVGVTSDEAGRVRLQARFQGEQGERLIALVPVPDGHYLSPSDVSARYRIPSKRDLEQLRALAARRAA